MVIRKFCPREISSVPPKLGAKSPPMHGRISLPWIRHCLHVSREKEIDRGAETGSNALGDVH